TSLERNTESTGLATTERRVSTGRVNEPATLGGGRSHPHRGRRIPRTKSPVDPLEACQSPADHCAVSYCRTRRSCRSMHPLRASCHHFVQQLRNRHCPKCQTAARERWIAARQKKLLPTRYVHVVFTLPAQLACLALHNKKCIYSLLLR